MLLKNNISLDIHFAVKKNFLKILMFFVVFNIFAFGQAISSDFHSSQYLAILLDWGDSWDINTVFKPYYWQAMSTSNSKDIHKIPVFDWIVEDVEKEIIHLNDSPLLIKLLPGINATSTFRINESSSDRGITLYSYAQIIIRKNIYLHIYPRITTNPEILNHFSGIPRKIKRFGFNSGEYDMSAIGYRNNWFTAEIGRGRQNWGSFSSDNLALSVNSAPYDYGLVQVECRKITVRYFHGFLETIWDEGNYNRYIVGHGVEYSNKRNLVLGITEIVTYSGLDRPLDIAYINPLHTHLEVELNRRTNRQNTAYAGSNAVWQIAGDWMINDHFRLSGNFLFDEFVMDKFERDEGRRSSTAFQTRLAYSKVLNKMAITISSDYTRVGSYTFRHDDGYNNFISREIPLGTEIGSDGDKWCIGLRTIFPNRFLFKSTIGISRSGERSILNNSYDALDQFTKVPFPSGEVTISKFINFKIKYIPKRNLELSADFHYASSNLDTDQRYIHFALNGYLPLTFNFDSL